MEIKHLTKKFGDKIVFNNFSVKIPKGKISFIMGESGCGKTTLLRILIGLDKDFSGEIKGFEGKISCVFQEPRLFPALNVIENLELVERGAKQSSEELLELVELENDAKLYPDELSGGMKMRLALARALYYSGDIFIMDEPFSALDEELKGRLLPKLFELLKGKTVIIVSHNPIEANTYGDNVIKI